MAFIDSDTKGTGPVKVSVTCRFHRRACLGRRSVSGHLAHPFACWLVPISGRLMASFRHCAEHVLRAQLSSPPGAPPASPVWGQGVAWAAVAGAGATQEAEAWRGLRWGLLLSSSFVKRKGPSRVSL